MKIRIALLNQNLTIILFYLAMAFTVDVADAQCPNRGTVVNDAISNSKGKPYEAHETRTIVTYKGDGSKKVVVTKANLFRESGGRTRVERFYDGTEDPRENVPTDISIHDNCGTSVILHPGPQTARITKMALPSKVSDRPYCEEVDLKNPPYAGPEGSYEDLGHKLIDGVEVRGQRESYYASAKAKLSGAPPVRVYENWCSVLLDTPMGDYILDERPKREITTVISDIKQIEPDPTLFEIPSGYKVIRAEVSATSADPKDSQRRSTPE